MAVVLPRGRSFTLDDLQDFPQDGNRYELIEGSLHVTPSPKFSHQSVLAEVFRVFDAACPPDHRVLMAPLDVIFSPITVLEPDLLVLPAGYRSDDWVRIPPLLTVEVLSPSTRAYDVGLKRQVYRDHGVGSYWVVDPEAPSVTVWDWTGDDELKQAATGNERLSVTRPFAVSVVPTDLV
jgi:Uma2 family endonuclease